MTIRTTISNVFYSIGDWAFTWGEMLDDRADEDPSHMAVPGKLLGITLEEYEEWQDLKYPDRRWYEEDHFGLWDNDAQDAVEGRAADIHFTEHELGRLEDDGGPARPAH